MNRRNILRAGRKEHEGVDSEQRTVNSDGMKKARMRACYTIEITTPKKFVLNGLWFGPRNPQRAIVWVHGLTSSAFSMSNVSRELVTKDTAVITFNNRGFGTINSIKRKVGRKSTHILGGAAHEIFAECADDIQGAINFARRQGAKKIYLIGHSTGCQKSVYWVSKRLSRCVKGIVLLAPISDYAAELHLTGKRKIMKAASAARALIRRGKKHELLPASLWSTPIDAQRFLSLYTPESIEEIFSYAQPRKNPRTLKSARVPVLVVLAEKDEFADRPAHKIAEWFENHIREGKVVIIPRAPHGFKEAERPVANTVQRWMN